MLESQIQRQIVVKLKKAGWVVDKPVHRSHNGFPDITAYRSPGHTVHIEVKRPGKKPDPVQIYWRDRLKNMGFDVFVIDNPKQLKELGLI